VVSAPKLEILGCVSDYSKNKTRLVFGSTVIQVDVHFCVFLHKLHIICVCKWPNVVVFLCLVKGFHVDSMAARICTVKTLAVNMGNQLSVKKAIAMLRCFPCLEKLYNKVTIFTDDSFCSHVLLFYLLFSSLLSSICSF
jgi:hypothetical protein